jgi:hypothetical protein
MDHTVRVNTRVTTDTEAEDTEMEYVALEVLWDLRARAEEEEAEEAEEAAAAVRMEERFVSMAVSVVARVGLAWARVARVVVRRRVEVEAALVALGCRMLKAMEREVAAPAVAGASAMGEDSATVSPSRRLTWWWAPPPPSPPTLNCRLAWGVVATATPEALEVKGCPPYTLCR